MSERRIGIAREGHAEGAPPAGGGEAGHPGPGPGGSGGPSVDDTPPAFRLLFTLALAGALAGLLLVVVHQWTQPRILAHQAAALDAAIQEVLGGPDRYETLYLVGQTLTSEIPTDVDSAGLDRVYLGFDGSNAPVGYAIAGGEPGFQDVIRLIFGYDAGTGEVLGMKVLESKETPGLGDKIEKDSSFVGEFNGVRTPLAGVKKGSGTGAPTEVDMITGATISSRAIINIINHRLEALGPYLDAARSAGSLPAGTGPGGGGR